MRGGLSLAAGAFLLAMGTRAIADPLDPEDPAPWHLQVVAKLDHAQSQAESGKAASHDRPRYLHLRLTFRPDLGDRKLHEFRVSDKDRKTVADVHGFYRDRSLLVFEGDWKNLEGLYLDGLGHREPLLPTHAGARSPDLGTQPTEGLQERAGDLRSAVSAGSATPRRAPSPWEIDPPPGDPSGHRRTASAARPEPSAGSGAGSGSAAGGGSGAGAGSGTAGGSSRGAGTGGSGIITESGMNAGPEQLTARAGGAGAGSAGGMDGGSGHVRLREQRSDVSLKSSPMILYLSCADPFGRGRIYQVDEHGIILGLVTLPYAATGLALHDRPVLVAAVPRQGGKLFAIDASGRVSVVLEDDPLLPQPVDVGIAGNSDALVVADPLAHLLAGTTIAGPKARELQRFALEKWDRPVMSVAVTRDKHVLFATDMKPGVYRFPADDFSPRPPVLPKLGGVAADTQSLRWAASQPPSQVAVFEGDALVKTLRLPANQSAYRHGLLSFAPPMRLVVAAQSDAKVDEGVWMIALGTDDDSARSLFLWRKEPILDFVVGPRMPWEPYEPDKLRNLR